MYQNIEAMTCLKLEEERMVSFLTFILSTNVCVKFCNNTVLFYLNYLESYFQPALPRLFQLLGSDKSAVTEGSFKEDLRGQRRGSQLRQPHNACS